MRNGPYARPGSCHCSLRVGVPLSGSQLGSAAPAALLHVLTLGAELTDRTQLLAVLAPPVSGSTLTLRRHPSDWNAVLLQHPVKQIAGDPVVPAQRRDRLPLQLVTVTQVVLGRSDLPRRAARRNNVPGGEDRANVLPTDAQPLGDLRLRQPVGVAWPPSARRPAPLPQSRTSTRLHAGGHGATR